MRSFRWIKPLLLIAVVAGILFLLDFVLYPCTFIRNDVHEVTSETFDDVIMGTSHGKLCIDPESMEEVNGRSGHNLCVGGEYPQDSIYLLKLMIETGHKPDRIVYEVSPGYLVREKEEGNNYLLFYHEFPLSRAKLSYFVNAIAKCNFRSLFFPWYEYPLSYELSHMNETAAAKWQKDYSVDRFRTESQEYHESGFVARYAVDTSVLTTDDLVLYPVSAVKSQNMEDIKKLASLCREEGIGFCAVTTPIPLPNLQAFAEDYNEFWDYMRAFFAEQQIPWINFNDPEHFNLFTHDITAFTDMDGHMNENAARAFSGVLAEQLNGYL